MKSFLDSEKEESVFSMIEVFPYLHYGEDFLSNNEDLNSLFNECLSISKCTVNIHVHSLEAQKQVSSWLIGNGFDDVVELQGNFIGMNENVDELSDDLNPEFRQYYSENADYMELILSKSNLSLSVTFDTYRLNEFKRTIKLLSKKSSIKNKWIKRFSKEFVIK